ncbi:DivIVA domain-containing protein [Plantactinospora sp. B5E13]|uniref:DivIVA domain-containing protein n=1 Tax=Plantactinospora sp. B5E13 TaxID=3153758 RepID=UPI00325D735D
MPATSARCGSAASWLRSHCSLPCPSGDSSHPASTRRFHDSCERSVECRGTAATHRALPTPTEIRAVRFGRGKCRRGLDPDEVYGFLDRLADEMELLRRDIRVAREDADRVKAALRNWQTRNARAIDQRWRGGRQR